MLELHQFRHSAFCLKVRMALERKDLSYRVVEVTPGIGQLTVFRISGQKQVPVLVDGDNVVSNSSAILRYLEELSPEPTLFPKDHSQEAQAHLIENWADTTLAKAAKAALLQAAALDQELRGALLPNELPEPFRKAIEGLPLKVINDLSDALNQGERQSLLSCLEKITQLVEKKRWLVGNSISAADLAVAAQLSLLRFPPSSGETLAGKGVPGITDHPQLQALFQWRDELELSLNEKDPDYF